MKMLIVYIVFVALPIISGIVLYHTSEVPSWMFGAIVGGLVATALFTIIETQSITLKNSTTNKKDSK